jgi:hypothetical protein
MGIRESAGYRDSTTDPESEARATRRLEELAVLTAHTLEHEGQGLPVGSIKNPTRGELVAVTGNLIDMAKEGHPDFHNPEAAAAAVGDIFERFRDFFDKPENFERFRTAAIAELQGNDLVGLERTYVAPEDADGFRERTVIPQEGTEAILRLTEDQKAAIIEALGSGPDVVDEAA